MFNKGLAKYDKFCSQNNAQLQLYETEFRKGFFYILVVRNSLCRNVVLILLKVTIFNQRYEYHSINVPFW